MPNHIDGVYRRKDRPGYWITWIDEKGRRRRRKTNAKTLSEARDLRSFERTKVEKAKALDVQAPVERKFEEVAEEYLTWRKGMMRNKNPNSYERERGIIKDHLIPAFRFLTIRQIQRKDVDLHVAKRAATMAPATVRKELTILKQILRQAVIWNYIPYSPADMTRSPKLPPPRVRYLHSNQLRALLEASPGWLRPIVALAVSTGMRRSEIFSLTWMDVDLDHNLLLLPQTKNGDGRAVHLNRSARTVIESLIQGEVPVTMEKLFTDVTPDQVSVSFRRLCQNLGILDFHFHDLRHTAASWLRMQGVDTHTVAQILGHKDMRMAARYQHLSPLFLGKAVGRLDKVIEASGGMKWEENSKNPISRHHSVTKEKQVEERLALTH